VWLKVEQRKGKRAREIAQTMLILCKFANPFGSIGMLFCLFVCAFCLNIATLVARQTVRRHRRATKVHRNQFGAKVSAKKEEILAYFSSHF